MALSFAIFRLKKNLKNDEYCESFGLKIDVSRKIFGVAIAKNYALYYFGKIAIVLDSRYFWAIIAVAIVAISKR